MLWFQVCSLFLSVLCTEDWLLQLVIPSGSQSPMGWGVLCVSSRAVSHPATFPVTEPLLMAFPQQ